MSYHDRPGKCASITVANVAPYGELASGKNVTNRPGAQRDEENTMWPSDLEFLYYIYIFHIFQMLLVKNCD